MEGGEGGADGGGAGSVSVRFTRGAADGEPAPVWGEALARFGALSSSITVGSGGVDGVGWGGV